MSKSSKEKSSNDDNRMRRASSFSTCKQKDPYSWCQSNEKIKQFQTKMESIQQVRKKNELTEIVAYNSIVSYMTIL